MMAAQREHQSAACWEAMASQWARHFQPGAPRSAQACVALGLELLMVKSLTPHGSFKDRVNALGLSASTAARYMAAARQFGHTSVETLQVVGSASKLMELLALDAASIAALLQGREAMGLTLERLQPMSVLQLRNTLRRAFHDTQRGALGEVPKKAPQSTKVTLSVEEERILRRYRQCDNAARTALLEVAGLLAQRPT